MKNINYSTALNKTEDKLVEELLRPTFIYCQLVKDLISNGIKLNGMAHITGGGLPENLPRCFPKGLSPYVDPNSWTRPKIFSWLKDQGEIPESDLWNTFNLGLGFCLVLPADHVKAALEICLANSMDAWLIGRVEESEPSAVNSGVLGLPT